MNVPYVVGILTVLCAVVAIIMFSRAWDQAKQQVTRKNIYRDIQPHQVAMMKQIFPKFDWVRIEREIAEAQKDQHVQYQPDYINEDGIIECSPKRLDIRV